MNEDNTSTRPEFPYDVVPAIFDNVIAELARIGGKGIDTGDLFSRIGKKSKPLKSHALQMCKVMKLVGSDGRRVFLTEDGRKYAFSNEGGKTGILGQNIPENYLSMLKWIKGNNGSLKAEKMKLLMFENFKYGPSKRVLNSAVNAFAFICERAGLLNHIKGSSPSFELTDKGHEILSLHGLADSFVKFHDTLKGAGETKSPSTGYRPIIAIVTQFGKFETSVDDIIDWELAEQKLRSWKEKWKNEISNRKTDISKS